MTGYGLGGPRFDCQQGQMIFLFSKTSEKALEAQPIASPLRTGGKAIAA
jgi:hypothetical protein